MSESCLFYEIATYVTLTLAACYLIVKAVIWVASVNLDREEIEGIRAELRSLRELAPEFTEQDGRIIRDLKDRMNSAEIQIIWLKRIMKRRK